MKTKELLFSIFIFLSACTPAEDNNGGSNNDTIVIRHEQVPAPEEPGETSPTPTETEVPDDLTKDPIKEPEDKKPVYSNKAFRNVTVVKTGNDTYQAKGQARVFEAAFSWVVEDGHYQLAKGHDMTDAGAPEWGNFDFTFKLEKKPDAGTKPHLILFVYSAKDGMPENELQIPLPG